MSGGPDERQLEVEDPAILDAIPAPALWAMDDRKHSFRRLAPDDPARVQCRLGSDDNALYVIEDGDDNCMVSRLVGEAPDGCVYCLVARVSVYRFEQLRDGVVELEDAFEEATDLCLCSVFESHGVASNLFVVQRYRRSAQVPDEYLPPSPYIQFTED